ncbi:MAG: OpgC domain-containing protein, partial [Gemmatimonadetes bacterium]|nr:OpgC domain-containing protein [Gemmatimonadota bacterium]
YFRPLGDPAERVWTYNIGMVASPTFMLLSGMMLGLLFHTKRDGFGKISAGLADRGLFMLTAGHLLIMLTCIPRSGSFGQAARLGFITDAVGVAVILGPLVVVRTRAGARLAAALGLYLSGLLLTMAWFPEGALPRAIKQVLAGPYPEATPNTFPFLPWLGVYLAGTVLGEWLGRCYQAGDARAAERGILKLGAAGVAVAVLCKAAMWTAGSVGLHGLGDPAGWAYQLTSPWRKLPPSPVYLAFFGGAGMLLVGMVLMAERRQLFGRYMDWASVLGRNSLFVFIAQFYVYYLGFYYLRLPYTPFWPLYFAASVAGLAMLARVWDERGWNRYLTLRRAPAAPSRPAVAFTGEHSTQQVAGASQAA